MANSNSTVAATTYVRRHQEAPVSLRSYILQGAVWMGVLLALFFIGAGANHFLNPELYRGMMPPWLPVPPSIQLVAGAAEMVSETMMHPALVREMVTSPGGTTIAGLAELERGGVRVAVMDAVRAATLRARDRRRLCEALRVLRGRKWISSSPRFRSERGGRFDEDQAHRQATGAGQHR
jgi:hypothetical protein